jgi:hypothetical protein
MFVHDPHTRKISKLMKHVRWLPSRSGALHTRCQSLEVGVNPKSETTS